MIGADKVVTIAKAIAVASGHCDPTANVHDWIGGVRGAKVEAVWPVSARGRAY